MQSLHWPAWSGTEQCRVLRCCIGASGILCREWDQQSMPSLPRKSGIGKLQAASRSAPSHLTACCLLRVSRAQLYLNYKMKSVAHLPWRQLTYKFLNTIIDDLFAFVIKMPLLHRLSVFRDDIVFLIYLYQRWIYRVDTKRANEFGCA